MEERKTFGSVTQQLRRHYLANKIISIILFARQCLILSNREPEMQGSIPLLRTAFHQCSALLQDFSPLGLLQSHQAEVVKFPLLQGGPLR